MQRRQRNERPPASEMVRRSEVDEKYQKFLIKLRSDLRPYGLGFDGDIGIVERDGARNKNANATNPQEPNNRTLLWIAAAAGAAFILGGR